MKKRKKDYCDINNQRQVDQINKTKWKQVNKY